jgi:hypothetical protein
MPGLIIFFIASSFVASAVTISACILSSRISQSQNLAEEYDSVTEVNRRVAPHHHTV